VWVLITVVGLVVELGVIVLLGRAATRGSEQDLPPRQAAQAAAQTAARTTAPAAGGSASPAAPAPARAAAARPPADRPVGGAPTAPPAVSRGAHRAAPAARR
jgi:hypothetical protein